MDRRQNLSYAQLVFRRTATEEIEAFKANVIINIHHSSPNYKILCKLPHRLKIASLTSSFNSSKLKLAHVNIRSCRNKEVEISLFLEENDIDILTLNKNWLKSNFKLDIPNYTITHRDRPRRQGGGVAILVRNDIKF